MPIRWNPGKLPMVVKALKETGVFRVKLMRALGEEVQKLIQEEFDGRTDPYEAPWEPTQRTNPILEDTGKLRRGFRMESGATTFRIRNDVDYATFHQYGTRYLVPRKMIPDTTHGQELPRRWSKRLQKVMSERAKEWLKP